MAANARVAVDYSLDDGSSWTPIAVTSDTSTTWTVPNAPTTQLRLRLRQVDAQNLTYTLSDQNSGAVARLTFRPDGKRLLVQHALNGELVEWDVAQRQITWRALPPDVGQIQPVMLAYIDTTHAVVLYNARGRGYASLFRIGDSVPLWSDTLLDQTIRSGVLDTANRTIAVIGTIAPTVELFRIESAAMAPLRSVPMPVLATALAVRRGDAFVALRDARIHHYRIPDWSPVAEYRFAYVPHIALLHALPDGKRLAIGCSVSQTSVVQGFSAPNFVLDLERNQIIRSIRQASSTPVAVTSSADARYLVFGYPGQPQSPLWDLATDMILSQATSHQGTLADVQFSPDQRYVASSSATPPLELVLRTFLFPATAVSPALTIGQLQLNADTLTFAPVYAYTQTDTIFRGRICNDGSVPIPLVDYWVEGGPTFQLVERIAMDTLKPGQCTDVLLRFAPTRAGRSTGALVVRHCEQQLRIPLAGTALPRSVGTPDTIDVGTACVGTPARTAHVVLTNNDPAPLPIGGAAIYDAMRSPFRLVAPPRDTIIDSKHALLLTIEFAPTSGGIAEGTLYVYYGWRDYTATVVLRGRGIGGTLQPHVSPLPFIPEQRVRELRLRNTQSDTLRITSAQIEPAGGFRLRTSMPLAIAPGDSASIAIEWLELDSVAATLVLRIDPCASELRVRLVRYSARAELQLPTVWADVRGRAAIPILARMIPNFDYGDPMRCTLRVATHRRLFMPDTAWTVRGIARLLSVTTDGDRRIATIEVERTLGTSGDTLVTLGGVAALGEQDTSVIAAVAAPYWGSAVEVTTTPGLLQLTGLCDDRRTYESGTVRMIVFPTPTSDPHVDIAIESTVQFHGELELYTMRGELVAAWPLDVTIGTTTASIPIASLDAGTYTLVLRGHSQRLVTRIVVVR
jgi:WD40 repeat protein